MRRSSNERYHDRVSSRYDEMYETDPYHVLCRDIAFRHLKPHLPRDLATRVLDAGCGTGFFGLRLARSGYAVDFLDLSQGMIDQARRSHAEAKLGGEPRFFHTDLERPDDTVPRGSYGLIVCQGDILSFVEKPVRAAAAVASLLAPGGVFSVSVDQRLAGIDHYLERGDLEGLARFCQTGDAEWLSKKQDERFAMHMFTADEIRGVLARAGLEVLSVVGKTVLPLRRHRQLLDDPETRRRLLAIEEKLSRLESALGRASHLDIIARKSAAAPVSG